MATMSRFLAFSAIAILVLGCALTDGPVSYPQGCERRGLDQRRCSMAVERAIATEHVDRAAIRGVELLPAGDVELGGRMVVRVRFRLADGTVR
jgi:hypothetical protein